MISKNDKTIARNTLFLYGRMILSIWISLYTMRVVLDVLGEKNYGIYNLVGGIVAIFAVLNAPMTAATSRFLNIELGKGDRDSLSRVFSTSLSIHFYICLLIFVLAESVGLWFVNTHLTIAPERMPAANWTYQFAILACLSTIMQVPYSAAILSHEKMDVYAYITLLNVVLKLVVVLALYFFPSFDKLIIYSGLIAAASIVILFIYITYCVRKFGECRTFGRPDKGSFKAMVSFSGFDLYGNAAFVIRAQGTNVILNNFGGTVLNAASGIANTVSMTIYGFAASIINAFRPQIIQNYARAEYSQMLRLLYNAARFSTLLMTLMITPCLLETEYILNLWLVETPQYTIIFCKICMMAACGELLNFVIGTGIHATGRIFLISFVSGTLYLCELPLMYFLIRWFDNPSVAYVIHLTFVFIILFVNSLILKRQLPPFSISIFWRKGVFAPITVFGITIIAVGFTLSFFDEGLLRLIWTLFATLLFFIPIAYWVALDRESREYINKAIIKKLSRLRHQK